MSLKLPVGLTLALLAIGSSVAIPGAFAQTFDAAKDFSATSDPNGAWSYGYENTLGGAFNLYVTQYAPTVNIRGWNKNISLTVPFVEKNFGTTQGSFADVVLQPGQLIFHPGPNNEFSIIRFTAPTTGLYTLNAGFTPVTTNGTTTDVHILNNGTSLFSGLVTGTYNAPKSAPSFSNNLNLNSGDIVDFAVGYGTNKNFSSDSTGITASFTPVSNSAPVPEASSLVSLGLMLLLGIGGMAVRRRKARTAG